MILVSRSWKKGDRHLASYHCFESIERMEKWEKKTKASVEEAERGGWAVTTYPMQPTPEFHASAPDSVSLCKLENGQYVHLLGL